MTLRIEPPRREARKGVFVAGPVSFRNRPNAISLAAEKGKCFSLARILRMTLVQSFQV